MLGTTTQANSVEYEAKVERFAKIVGRIFDGSAKLMSIPPQFADKWNLKMWTDFEAVAKESIELCE